MLGSTRTVHFRRPVFTNERRYYSIRLSRPMLYTQDCYGTEKTFYLETFGCQMNAHDSEKVIGTLQHQGYRQVTRKRKPA